MDILYFYSPGACSLSGQIALEWLAEPYSLCRVDRETRASDAYKRINPLNRVPALRADGKLLAENSAILTFLAKRKPGLLPAPDTWESNVANQWLSYLGTTLHIAFAPIFAPARVIKDESKHAEVKELAEANVRKQFAFINDALGNKTWLVGEQKTLVDAYLYTLSRWGKKLVSMQKDYPSLHAHQTRLESDPAVKFALDIDAGNAGKSPSGAFKKQMSLSEV